MVVLGPAGAKDLCFHESNVRDNTNTRRCFVCFVQQHFSGWVDKLWWREAKVAMDNQWLRKKLGERNKCEYQHPGRAGDKTLREVWSEQESPERYLKASDSIGCRDSPHPDRSKLAWVTVGFGRNFQLLPNSNSLGVIKGQHSQGWEAGEKSNWKASVYLPQVFTLTQPGSGNWRHF